MRIEDVRINLEVSSTWSDIRGIQLVLQYPLIEYDIDTNQGQSWEADHHIASKHTHEHSLDVDPVPLSPTDGPTLGHMNHWLANHTNRTKGSNHCTKTIPLQSLAGRAGWNHWILLVT